MNEILSYSGGFWLRQFTNILLKTIGAGLIDLHPSSFDLSKHRPFQFSSLFKFYIQGLRDFLLLYGFRPLCSP